MVCKHLNDGGGGGIRTPARLSTPLGFQDRPLQPDLGTPPYRHVLIYHNDHRMSIFFIKKFESRLCGRFFSRPIFLVIYGFIKSLYVSAFTYSHPVGMCVFSRFKNLSMLAMPRKSVSLKIGEGMGCYLVPLLSFAFARASVPFSRSFLVSFLLVLPRHTSLHRVSE